MGVPSKMHYTSYNVNIKRYYVHYTFKRFNVTLYALTYNDYTIMLMIRRIVIIREYYTSTPYKSKSEPADEVTSDQVHLLGWRASRQIVVAGHPLAISHVFRHVAVQNTVANPESRGH